MGAPETAVGHLHRDSPMHGRLIAAWLGLVACLLALPAAAMATTTAQVSASFTGSKLGAGTSLHYGFTTSESSGGLPQLPEEAIIHLPHGTHIAKLMGLPKSDLCSANILEAADLGPSACPKGSHAGPVGSAHLEAVVGGHLITVKARLYPIIDKVGLFSLWLSAPAPFPSVAATLFPYAPGGSQELILREMSALEVSPGVRSSMLDFSITLGANLKVGRGGRSTTEPLITMPRSCPTGGFAWSTDFTYWDASRQTVTTTSPCPGKGAARAASIDARTAHPHVTVTTPKSQLECEEEYGKGTSWHRCFKQPPGSSCAHPLEVQKAGETTRGDAKDFTTTFHEEAVGGVNVAAEQYYSWAPKKGIAMCPYPNGVVYKVSLTTNEEFCENIHGKKYCATEYDTKNIPEHTGPTGSSFEYYLTDQPLKSFYLAVRGYYIHPPGKQHRR
jgi:hypothetical protein